MGIFKVGQWIFRERIKPHCEAGVLVWTSRIISSAVKTVGKTERQQLSGPAWAKWLHTPPRLLFFRREWYIRQPVCLKIREDIKHVSHGIFCFTTNEKNWTLCNTRVFGERFILLKPVIIFTLKVPHVCVEVCFGLWFIWNILSTEKTAS